MAKGSFLLYGSSGKIGNIVVSQSQGETIIREKVDPSNPRTMPQMRQRLKFATFGTFYKRAVQNLFVFAFENKRQRESDFNAFVRENNSIAPTMSTYMIANQLPVIAPWRMTNGRLNIKQPLLDNTHQNPYYSFMPADVPGIRPAEGATISNISRILCAMGAENGDIITWVNITHNAAYPDNVREAIEAKTTIFDSGAMPVWELRQVVVDVNNDSTIVGTQWTHIVEFLQFADYGPSILRLRINTPYSIDTNWISAPEQLGYCIIASHVKNDKTEVSPSMLQLNQSANTVYALSSSSAWIDWCAGNYTEANAPAPETVILNGALTDENQELVETFQTFALSPTQPGVTVMTSADGWVDGGWLIDLQQIRQQAPMNGRVIRIAGIEQVGDIRGRFSFSNDKTAPNDTTDIGTYGVEQDIAVPRSTRYMKIEPSASNKVYFGF